MAKPSKEMMSVSQKSHSHWWNSHISPENFKWLSENLKEMDQRMKEMLKLIEEDGATKNAEMYHQKRPELVSHVEEFHCRYRTLAERYDQVTFEFSKSIPSGLQSPVSAFYFSAEPSTPNRKQVHMNSEHRASGLFLASSGSFYISSKGSDGSSLSSDSGSDSDEATLSKTQFSVPLENGDDYNILRRRIFELESELEIVKQKLQATEEENSNTLALGTENVNEDKLERKLMDMEKPLIVTTENPQLSEAEIVKLQCELDDCSFSEIKHDMEAKLESSCHGKTLFELVEEENPNTLTLDTENVNEDQIERKLLDLAAPLIATSKNLQYSEEEIMKLQCELENCGSSDTKCDLEAKHESSCNGETLFESAEEVNPNTLAVDAENVNEDKLQKKLLDLGQPFITTENIQHSEQEIAKLQYEIEDCSSTDINHNLDAKVESSCNGKILFVSAEEENPNTLALDTETVNEDKHERRDLDLEGPLIITTENLQHLGVEIVKLQCQLKSCGSSDTKCNLEAKLESSGNKTMFLESTEEKNISLGAQNVDEDKLENKLLDFEKPLTVTIDNLQHSEEVIGKLKCKLGDHTSDNNCDLEGEHESSCEVKKLSESKLELVNIKIESLECELRSSQKENVLLEAELCLERKKISEMLEQIIFLEAAVVDDAHIIDELRVRIFDVTQKHSQEKLELEAEVSGLTETCASMQEKLRDLDLNRQSLADSVKQLESEKLEMQTKLDRALTECSDSCKLVKEIDENLDALQLKYDELVAERGEFHVKVQNLAADVSSRDNMIHDMDRQWHLLRVEHVQLKTDSENAQKLVNELQRKVSELEDEIERQRVVISENAEAKREAIRQLCFSLDHYRDEYLHLLQALHAHKRPRVIAT